ncbi:MAG TPA: alpha/beta hydrolase [Bacteroidales bacterium]|nr:alpha/beta hydrolase [Bacteroidales bacterium]
MKRTGRTMGKTLRRTLYAILLISVVACRKDPPAVVEVVTRDISYGVTAQQKMDVWLPEGRNTADTKTVIVIHGGGWVQGDKSEMAQYVDSLRKRMPDYAFVNLNYRLAYNNSVNVFPVQENDVKAAIEFYLDHAAEYMVSDDLVLLGASAGGHLAMLHAYKNDPAGHVKAVVDFFGPFNLTVMWDYGLVHQLILYGATGAFPVDNPAIYSSSSPSSFITTACPPTIAFQGGTDPLVPPAQTTLLISMLDNAGVVNQLVYYPAESHGWIGANLVDTFNKIERFLADHVE